MEKIFSLVKVTYDYFRYEDLMYVGTLNEIKNILLKEQPMFVKMYGLKEKKYRETEDINHYWVYNRDFDDEKIQNSEIYKYNEARKELIKQLNILENK